MSKYCTIDSDYKVLELDSSGNIKKEAESKIADPVYYAGIINMIRNFNSAHLEKYLDDDLKDKINSITMELTNKVDTEEKPFVRITFQAKPFAIRFTQKVKDRLDEYMLSQFTDGWGEGFFYPYSFTAPDGTIIAVE